MTNSVDFQTTSAAPASTKSDAPTPHHPTSCDAPFPLRFVPFEAMASYDNWQDYPMTCGAIFTMRGTIDPAAFNHAVHIASQRHPLLCAFIERGPRGHDQWVASNRPFKVQWIGEAEATDFAACQPYDLRREHGVRIWVQQRDEVGTIFVEFHHSCCDGAGGMSFIDDVFAVYASQVTGEAAELPPIDLTLLRTRGKFASVGGTWKQKVVNFFSDLKHSATMALRVPLTMAAPSRSKVLSRQTWAYSRLVSNVLDRKSYEALRASAVAQGVTLNDFLVSQLFQTLVIWNQRLRSNDKGWIRILIPVNLRTRADFPMPMTNRLSYGFLTRRSETIADDEQLTASVSAENAKMRRIGLPQRLLEKFWLMQHTSLWPLIFSPKRCLATAVFSNLGDPTRRFRTRFARKDGLIQVGNLQMTAFEGTTALRPMTRAGIFVNTYGNQITISTRFDPSHYTVADAEAFLDLFTAQILESQIAKPVEERRAA